MEHALNRTPLRTCLAERREWRIWDERISGCVVNLRSGSSPPRPRGRWKRRCGCASPGRREDPRDGFAMAAVRGVKPNGAGNASAGPTFDGLERRGVKGDRRRSRASLKLTRGTSAWRDLGGPGIGVVGVGARAWSMAARSYLRTAGARPERAERSGPSVFGPGGSLEPGSGSQASLRTERHPRHSGGPVKALRDLT